MVNILTKKLQTLACLWLVLLSFCLFYIPTASAVTELNQQTKIVRIALISSDDRATSMRRWRATANYLSAALPEYSFVLIYYPYSEFNKASRIKLSENDLFIVNPVDYFTLRKHSSFIPLATMKKQHGNYLLNSLSGAVVTRADCKDINKFSDLKGRHVTAVSPQSMGGWIAQWREYIRAGVRLAPKASQVTFVGSGEKVLKSLDSRETDVGFVKSGLLESMAVSGKIKLDSYKVLPQRLGRQSFPMQHSTTVYPEQLIALNPNKISVAMAEKMLDSLLKLQPTDYATITGGYGGWSVPRSYRSVEQCLKDVGIIKDARLYTVTGFIYVFRYPLLIIAAVLFVALLNYYLKLQRLNQGMNRYLKRQAELIKEQLMIKTELDYAKDEESTILENISDGVIYVDRKMRVVWVNGVVANYLDTQPNNLLGKISHELWDAENDANEPYVTETAISTRRHVDAILQLRDGRTFEVGAEPVFDNKNEIKGVVETFKDITQRNKTEEELREGQRLYELTMNAINEGLYDYDCKNDIFTYSSTLVEILGYQPDELSESFAAWRKLVHPDEQNKLTCFQGTGRFSFSARMKHKNDNWIWMLCRGMCVEIDPGGKPIRIVGTITNIQQRKIAEEMLKREKERLALILKSSGLGFWTWDFANKTIELDDNWMKMTGYEFSSNNIADDFWRNNIHADDIDGFDNCISELRKGTGNEYNYSFRLHHKSGRWIWLHGVGNVIKRDRNGMPLIMVGMHQDISEQVQREQAIAVEVRERKKPTQRVVSRNAGSIPLPKPEVPKKYHPSIPADADINSPLVLLVEDNDVNLLLLKALLKKLNITTISAENGVEALDALEAGEFKFILMDCQMPVMDGYEATRQIRKSHASWADIPIIAMTANAMVGDEEKCFAAGMNDYISKPVDFALLKKITGKYL
ncbi:MAG: PAS domain-containing protein [Victivallaceae bacterium]|nr:PAS domain-containing protein [Victivallaceae bacterium]